MDVNSGRIQLGQTAPGPSRIALETILVSLDPGELLLEKSCVVNFLSFYLPHHAHFFIVNY